MPGAKISKRKIEARLPIVLSSHQQINDGMKNRRNRLLLVKTITILSNPPNSVHTYGINVSKHLEILMLLPALSLPVSR